MPNPPSDSAPAIASATARTGHRYRGRFIFELSRIARPFTTVGAIFWGVSCVRSPDASLDSTHRPSTDASTNHQTIEPVSQQNTSKSPSIQHPDYIYGNETDLPSGATRCGALRCLQFSTSQQAFSYVLELTRKGSRAEGKWVLGLGESHAQKGTEHIKSCAARFTEELLPMLAGNASDLVLELMLPPQGCDKTERAVEHKHEVVKKQQAATAQSEYVTMGNEARKRGIIPDVLRPSCEQLQKIDQAGDGAIDKTLETIARLTEAKVERLLAPKGRPWSDAHKAIVVYGGVLHNDPNPKEASISWSYGPWMQEHIGKGYVALDLFVPEFIRDTDTWRQLPWHKHYDREKMGNKATLYTLEDGSMALIFPLQNQ